MILYIYKRKEEDPCIDRECNALHRLVKKKKKKAQGRTQYTLFSVLYEKVGGGEIDIYLYFLISA